MFGSGERADRDEKLIETAGIRLDRALFSLLIGIEKLGPIGVMELAERVGRDHATVSRQVARLESLGLVKRQENATDRRVREAVISPEGKAMTVHIDEARERIGRTIFSTWTDKEIEDLVRLMRKFADALEEEPPADP